MLAILTLVCVIVISLIWKTEIMPNAWGLLTGQGYIIPTESSIWNFKVYKMNEGSGEWWLYGEDDYNYYSMMKATSKEPYILISKSKAGNCDNFDKLNYETWCE